MKIKHLKKMLPLQESLRDVSKLPFLVGEILSDHHNKLKLKSKISINFFKDCGETYMIHDGHHRVVAYMLADRAIPDDSIKFTDYSLDEYLEVNLKDNWVTPINPFFYARRCNLSSWRKMVKYKRRSLPDEYVEEFIKKNQNIYTLNRQTKTVENFARQYKNIL